jgi:O-antigen ligase
MMPFLEVLNHRIGELVIQRFYFSGRDELYELALDNIFNMPIAGYGLANYYDESIGFHPHNLILQLILDLGIFAILNVAVLIYFLYVWVKIKRNILAISIPFMIMVHMLSGTYYDLRYLFVYIALLSIIKSSEYKNKLK